jgi:CheY-like chemotaxis protein
MLRSVGGSTDPVRGTVRRCRHVSGRFHELGIEFERAVNPREYLISIGSEYLFNAERVEPSHLRGRVLLFTVDDADRRAYLRELADTKIEMECIQDAGEAIARLGSEFDLVFADVDDQEDLAVEFAERARHSRKLAPIVVIARSDDPELRLAAIGAGASELLFKPVGTDLLYQAATEYLACIHDEELAGISMDIRALNDAPDESSSAWLVQLGTAADTLEADVAGRNSQSAMRTLKTMHDLARRFGLTHAAESLLNASRSLERCGQCSGAMTEIRRALRSVRRIGAAPGSAPAAAQQDAA